MTVDPPSFFRDMLGQWETMANQFGGATRSPEAGRAMDAATAAGAKMQEATHDAMSRTLAAYNMPSREEVTSLADRLSGVEEQLSRIEALLTRMANEPPSPATPPPSEPRRSRVPPTDV